MASSRLLNTGRGLLGTAILSVPVLVWLKDKRYGVYYVSGNSMEPTLRSGDVVLVRKFDLPFRRIGEVKLHQDNVVVNNDNHPQNNNNNNKNAILGIHSFPPNADEYWERDLEDAAAAAATATRLHRHQRMIVSHHHHHLPIMPSATNRLIQRLHNIQNQQPEDDFFGNNTNRANNQSLWSSLSAFLFPTTKTPPRVLDGEVIVFWSPTHYQQLCIKRVIGVGGQMVLPRDFELEHVDDNDDHDKPDNHDESSSSSAANSRSTTLLLDRDALAQYVVPPMCWHVEGDHADQSHDSRHYGPVPERLLVGVVDRIVWPRQRAQVVSRTIPQLDKYPLARTWWE